MLGCSTFYTISKTIGAKPYGSLVVPLLSDPSQRCVGSVWTVAKPFSWVLPTMGRREFLPSTDYPCRTTCHGYATLSGGGPFRLAISEAKALTFSAPYNGPWE